MSVFPTKLGNALYSHVLYLQTEATWSMLESEEWIFLCNYFVDLVHGELLVDRQALITHCA